MFEIVLRWKFLNRSFIIMCWGKVLSKFTGFDPRSWDSSLSAPLTLDITIQ